jgi:hypothetical protein
MIDRDGSGKIDYDEFMRWHRDEDKFGKLKLDDSQLQALQVSTQISNL